MADEISLGPSSSPKEKELAWYYHQILD
jgi:hypothetical protein